MFRRRILYLSSFSIPLYTTPAYSCSYTFQTNQRPSTLLKRVHSLTMSNPPVQPADNGMAVVAPNLESNPATVASHVPQIAVKDGDDSMSENEQPLSKSKANGARKRVDNSSDEEEKPLSKKPRANGVKKKRVVASSDEESDASPPVKKPASKQSKPATADSDDDDYDQPLAKKPNGLAAPKRQAKKPVSSKEESSEESSEEEKPLAKTARRASAKKVKSETEGSEEEQPLAKKKAPVKRAPAKKAAKKEPSESEEDEKPLAKNARGKAKAAQVKEEKGKKTKKEKEEEEEEEKYKWWEQDALGDGSSKWTVLEHNAVLFPPPYVPLPKDVKMKYDGVSLTLPPESEEVAGFFGALLETDYAQDAKFRENFFRDFKAIVEKYPPKEDVKVKKLEKCDFRPMFEYFEKEKEKKKALTKEEKKAIKAEKDKLEAPYLYANVDGRKEKVGNFRAEPPGLFKGRGEHPKKGTVKNRLRPEDIIINIGKEAPIPVPNIPGQWKGIQHDNTVTWLAHWKENVNGNAKYVFLSAGSAWKGQSDRAKFEKARELIKHVDKIRKDYTADLKSKIMADRQRATALYFIDRLALRAGNEKGEDEADTVGCCSLRYEHVTLSPPNTIIFDFLGKDSMRFHQEVEVDPQVFKNIKLFKADPKKKGDDIFDRLTTTLLNKHLNGMMPGLTAKVFRTYNASWTFQEQLKNTPTNGTVAEKIAAYNTANRDVAILCNHQKSVSKGFEGSFAKAEDKIRALKYQRLKLRLQLFSLNPKIKKKHPELAEDESDVDDEFMERHEAELLEKALENAKKKWDTDNVKLEGDGKKKKTKGELDERLSEIKAEFKELKKERKAKKIDPKRGATEEKLLAQIARIDERIATAKVQLQDRDKLKDVALGTSKINYIDPRLTVAWAKKFDVPLEKLFSKTLREKFPWAEAEAGPDWVF
ncbi:DNA topoisomerase I [Cryptococcus neoformans var. grubii Br795]|nr:DNA topoisomerase I [Cryptococcus neoformans var. grubii 125.91]OXG37329.1 DNA topoisomerase I [Cryptococcus neoformans var. grubii Bt120]OXG76189.1 DNA topoisomerase I [Cryptococcus neoformans var. grubii MW-RSA36]OXG78066.1 DNA topoisomerase I [Cryptococcus neoformans var. grubii Br795]OXG81664.1 DNA topoisomerase I [Cryptococcus neoformans var. grubii D17-1]OXG93597.1 DNA topoisomerase I [Cryptococcus neoformans var. grubii A2-102-5]OXH05557.1 DNA topoisomerase I [Cryptococcus neoforman